MEHNFQVGDLVKWFESYADGFLTRDVGLGTVVEICEYHHMNYINYAVYRHKHQDTMHFEPRELDYPKKKEVEKLRE